MPYKPPGSRDTRTRLAAIEKRMQEVDAEFERMNVEIERRLKKPLDTNE